jgi:ABC-type bacteriocin/lantibiotic exporter with double-glycine peptidase domain
MRNSLAQAKTQPMTHAALQLLGRALLAWLCLGCASYRGSSQTVSPARAVQQGKWWLVPNFPLVLQESSHDCGAAALAAVLRYWGYSATPASIERRLAGSERRLVAGDMVAYARELGLNAYVFFGTMTDVVHELRRGRPVIVGLGKSIGDKQALSHYEVVVGYEPEQKRVMLLDPGRGWQIDSLRGFGEEWARTKGVTMVAFLPAGEVRVPAP